MIFDLGDRREGDLNDLAVGAFDLHAGSGERLGGFHAFNSAAHTLAIGGNNLDVVLTVKRLQRCECLGYFHRPRPPWVNMPFSAQEVHRTHWNATGKHDLAYRTCPCILRLNANNGGELNVAGYRNHMLKLPFEDAV